MKANLLILLIAAFFALGVQCVGPTYGALFTTNKFAGEFNPENDVPVTKTGEGCHYNILRIVSFGDSSAGTIAKENGITRIATVDHKFASAFLYLYQEMCTYVSGD